MNKDVERSILLDDLKNADMCPAHRNCNTCAYRNGEGNRCGLMILADKLIDKGWTLSGELKRDLIEIDIDGVVGNIFNNFRIRHALTNLIPNWNEDMITDYELGDIKKLYPKAYDKIISLFGDPKFYEEMPMYKGTLAALRKLVNAGTFDICFHTLIKSGEDCVNARSEWIEDLIEKIKPRILPGDSHINISYQVDLGKKVMVKDVSCVIEDCPENLENSTAQQKILIAKSYNRAWARLHPEVNVVHSLCEAIDLIIR